MLGGGRVLLGLGGRPAGHDEPDRNDKGEEVSPAHVPAPAGRPVRGLSGTMASGC